MSRGLGDVYKRQNLEIADAMAHTMYSKTQERVRISNVMLNLIIKNKY